MATKAEAPAETLIEGTKIKWDDSNMKSAYANVCNVSSTREEVVLYEKNADLFHIPIHRIT